jgi:preprotein translocase subunit SecD
MIRNRIFAVLLLVVGVLAGYFIYHTEVADTEKMPFHLGLDLSGGSYLVYRADLSEVNEVDVKDSMESLRDVIERRINLFGVSEPRVTTETHSFSGEGIEERLVVELPGVTDIDQAIEQIGQTPLLEFKLLNPDFDHAGYQDALEAALDGGDLTGLVEFNADDQYLATGLTGRYLEGSQVQISQGGSGMMQQTVIALDFNKEGGDLFEEITTDHVGEILAIFLDGSPISTPVIQTPISGGEAIITGDFTPDEAKQLAGRLNSGALPVPIELINTQTIGPSLGAGATEAGVKAGLWGLIAVILFMILYYRLPGVISGIALVIYTIIVLSLFKVIPVTLTSAGIAGFVISIGIAVDANILIFERMKEELRAGRTIYDAISEGFSRAWPSIRDANLSSLISAVVLFWFGSSLIQGFALTFGIGVLVSMISAITVSRIFLLAVAGRANGKVLRWLYSAGFIPKTKQVTGETQE